MSKKLSTIVGGGVASVGPLTVASGGTGVSTSTGSGNLVLSTSPTLVAPILGTPTSGVLTNCTGYTYANLSGTIPTWGVANGGTGATTLTGILIGNGTSAVTTIAAPSGTIVGTTDTQTVTNKTLTTTALYQSRVAMAANDINLSLGNAFSKTISGATTLTVSNVPTSGLIATFILDLTNGGSAAITWWTVKWVGGTAPTLTTAGRDTLGFFTHDGGATWSGVVIGKDIK
jgi:hypothetical protein